MLAHKLKSAVKSVPFFYNTLMPIVVLLRRVRSLLQRDHLKKFRRYCIDLPGVAIKPVFVKVGANDGITGDPCSDLLLEGKRWKGVLIEPVPYCFDRLKSTFHDEQRFSLLQVAVGAPAGEATFYYVDSNARKNISNLPSWYDQLGSFDKSHIVKHLDGALAPFIVECKVEVRLLSDILRENEIRDVHLLHIDTEGHDYEVLKTLDFSCHAPVAIFVEYKHLPDTQKAEMLVLFRIHGYSVYDCDGDYFALDKKAYKRLKKMGRYVANV